MSRPSTRRRCASSASISASSRARQGTPDFEVAELIRSAHRCRCVNRNVRVFLLHCAIEMLAGEFIARRHSGRPDAVARVLAAVAAERAHWALHDRAGARRLVRVVLIDHARRAVAPGPRWSLDRSTSACDWCRYRDLNRSRSGRCGRAASPTHDPRTIRSPSRYL